MEKLITLLVLFIGISGFSQDTFLQNSNERAESEAIRITDQYNSELALSGDQQVLFQKKVEEFLVRRYKIENEYTGKKKLNYLLDMQLEETSEMNDILTRPQLEVYKKIKPRIQPLDIVGEK